MEPAEQVIEWVQLREHPDYDIQTTYPFLIRKRSNRRIIKLTPAKDEYLLCKLNGKMSYHHRVVALQFLPNPENLRDVDHINHKKDDNHLANLRWASRSDNNRNKSSHKEIFEFMDQLPPDAIAIEEWNGHRFEGIYYIGNGEFAIFNGISFRKMTRILKRRAYFVWAFDVEHRLVMINIAKYRIMIDDVPIAEPNDEDNIIN
jgi:hypothetical protein